MRAAGKQIAVAPKTSTETPRVKMKRVKRWSNGMSTTCHSAIPHNTVRKMGWDGIYISCLWPCMMVGAVRILLPGHERAAPCWTLLDPSSVLVCVSCICFFVCGLRVYPDLFLFLARSLYSSHASDECVFCCEFTHAYMRQGPRLPIFITHVLINRCHLRGTSAANLCRRRRFPRSQRL